LAGVEVAFRTGGDLIFTVGGLGALVGSAVGGDITTSAAGSSAEDNGAASMTGGDIDCDAGEAMMDEDADDILGLSSVAVVFGGHSLFCRISSLAESPVVCDATLVLRGNPGGN
jgi:hypothetical protein